MPAYKSKGLMGEGVRMTEVLASPIEYSQIFVSCATVHSLLNILKITKSKMDYMNFELYLYVFFLVLEDPISKIVNKKNKQTDLYQNYPVDNSERLQVFRTPVLLALA